jgi:integrase-like protein
MGPVPGLHRSPVRRDGRPPGCPARRTSETCRHRRVRDAGSRPGARVGHAQEPPTPRGPDPAVPRDRARLHIRSKQPDDLVFAGIRSDQPLRVSTFRTAFSVAARAIGVPDLHPHLLRHTAASLAIAGGADVKVVQQMLGHSSATMTLDSYGHLFEDRLDEVGSALDAAREAARARREGPSALPRVAPVLPEPDFAGNAEAAQDSVFGWSGPLFGVVPPTGFEPALPP